MRRFIEGLKHNKEFLLGIVALLSFLGAIALFIIAFMADPESVPGIAVAKTTAVPEVTKKVIVTATPVASSSPVAAATATPKATPTNTPTDTPVPTATPVPLTPEQKKLKDQVALKAEEYDRMYREAEEKFNLPVINITTLDWETFNGRETVVVNNKKRIIDVWIPSSVEVFNCEEKYRFTGFADVKVRGNPGSSAQEAPYPLRIKFDEKKGMLGLNNGNDFKNWVLLKPWTTVLGDYLALEMGQKVYDGKYYISDCTPVNVCVNGEYYGLYMLAEQNQVKKKRVNINEAPEGYTGVDIGYFVEIDNYAGLDLDAKPSFSVPYRVGGKTVKVTDFEGTEGTFVNYTRYTIHSDVYSDEQIAYISKYINKSFEILWYAVTENRFYALNDDLDLVPADDRFKNAEECLSSLMDMDSVVETYIIEEIIGNYDRGNGSFYMAVDFSKKAKYDRLTFIAPWDFNWCVLTKRFVAGTFYGVKSNGKYGEMVHPWFVLLMKEDWFRQKVAKRWDELYSTGMMKEVLDATIKMTKESKADFDYFGSVYGGDKYGTALETVSSLENRLKWLNSEILKWLPD